MRGIPPYDACRPARPGNDARSGGTTKGQAAGTSAYDSLAATPTGPSTSGEGGMGLLPEIEKGSGPKPETLSDCYFVVGTAGFEPATP
jgi:hypothetical protein